MPWVCRMCGLENDGDVDTCMCGFKAGESVRDGSDDVSAASNMFLDDQTEQPSLHVLDKGVPDKPVESKKIKLKASEKPVTKKTGKAYDEILIKEIDSWKFTFSKSEKCLYLGTPALQSFRLKLSLKDLQDLLEFLYEKTGMEMTMRKLQLSNEDILEFVSILDNMIEEKRSKLRIRFSDDEIKAIADMINTKLKE